MELTTVWFGLIAVLWIGYFCLEGFDFGVGMLLPVLARDETERRVLINTIGPVWDGNEVWVLVAGGATFAAFPEWYATLFSGFYLPLLLILVALIVRGLAFEYRAKRDDDRWRAALGPGDHRSARSCRRCCGAWRSPTSCAACRSTPTRSTSATLLTCSTRTPCSAAGHHAAALPHPRRAVPRAEDRRRHPAPGPRAGPAVGARRRRGRGGLPGLDPGDTGRPDLLACCSSLAALALVGGPARRLAGREGWAFLGTFAAIGAGGGRAVRALFPDVMPSTLDPAVLADDDERLGHRLHADDHDLGRGALHPDRAALPGLDLLGVPQADRDPPHPHPATARGRGRPMRPPRPRGCCPT